MRWWVVAGATVVVLGAAAVVAIAVNPTEDASPHETLARARRFVADAASVEYRQEARFLGTTIETREQVRFPDEMQAEVTSDFYVAEVVILGDDVYGREAEKPRQLARQAWWHESLDEGPDPGFVVGDPAAEGPEWIGRLLGQGTRPRFTGRTDSTETLVVDLPRDLFGDQSVPLGPDEDVRPPDRITATITLDGRGAPRRMVVRTHGGDLRVTSRITIEHWNGPVRIAMPAKEDIDATPEIDEIAIEKFRSVDPIVPAAIPRGWEQTFAGVADPEWTEAACKQLNFTYEDPERFDEEGESYLDLYVNAPGCHRDEPPRSEPFVAGPHQGWIALDSDGWGYGEIEVAAAVVSFDTDLAPGEVAQILAALVPFDPTRPPPDTLPIGATL